MHQRSLCMCSIWVLFIEVGGLLLILTFTWIRYFSLFYPRQKKSPFCTISQPGTTFMFFFLSLSFCLISVDCKVWRTDFYALPIRSFIIRTITIVWSGDINACSVEYYACRNYHTHKTRWVFSVIFVNEMTVFTQKSIIQIESFRVFWDKIFSLLLVPFHLFRSKFKDVFGSLSFTLSVV